MANRVKKGILLLILVLTSGCTVNYHITINEDNEITEEIAIQTENQTESQKLYEDPWPTKVFYSDPESGEYPEKIPNVEYYNENLFINDQFYQKKLTYTFLSDQYKDANSIKSCYEHFYYTVNQEENTITLSTSPKFLCMEDFPDLKQVNISIEVKNPVINSNATSVQDGQYNWVITPENYEKSSLILTYSKINPQKVEKQKKSNLMTMLIVFGGFIVCILGVVIFKIKKNN